MAGGDYHPYRSDPAIERWQTMHSSMYQRFRFTPRTTRKVLAWGLVTPVLMYALAKYSDDRWELRARTRTESLLRYEPKTDKSEGDAEE
ncbi:hypothetical protein FA10DRAFT_301273 [Acaromyces ingoldii]|uniref:NADH dehydrogenase [ubiquinone] 1 beta subcomplex subunit 4 n=1 Tax=Acaromyces ingoldii TaxID=215250 RepID=A0A316YK96_9BASI|nr:hypothetical protein FA10DRAFT_301273 [Acaromyces ingoldii]PWN89980.1 hypothetical protein FA10DRAFT_301273 [Acaromyces ingoldii]